MEYRDEKRRLYRNLVAEGANKAGVKEVAKRNAVAAPDDLIDKWENRFFASPIATYPTEPRLVNRFCIGADPEFIFTQTLLANVGKVAKERYIHAEQLGLNTIDAFGCDMSGRQAELRAYPSRFVLEVVASLVDTVRWMNEFHKLDGYNWLAPARWNDGVNNDGVGGHVHIGRKRPDLDTAIQSLDACTQLLLAAGVLDAKGQADRRANTHYGRFGDWRPQTHGYEYRTMPSWMTSPWAAYFTLVVSKLAVLEDVREFMNTKRPVETLVNLLRAYKGRDDDARIALLALDKQGFPKYEADDFKARWGVAGVTGITKNGTYYAPPVISPSGDTCRGLFDALVRGTQIPRGLPKATWEPFKLPDGVFKPTAQSHVYGISDVAQGLLCRGYQSNFFQQARGYFNIMAPKLIDIEPIRMEFRKHPEIAHWKVQYAQSDPGKLNIGIPKDIYNENNHATNKDMRTAIRTVLTESGLFPFVKYQDFAKPIVEKAAPKKNPPKVIGRVVTVVHGRNGNGIEVEEE